jgi:hypothetical protein
MTTHDWHSKPDREPKAMLIWVKLLLLLGTLALVIWLMAKLNQFSAAPLPPPNPAAVSPTPQSFEVQFQMPTPATGPRPAPPPAASPPPAGTPHARLVAPAPGKS